MTSSETCLLKPVAVAVWQLLMVIRCAAALSASPAPAASDLVTAPTQIAIERGLAYLAQHQADDGSFGADGYRRNVAVCSLGGLAFLASDSTPGRGPFGDQINHCLDYILNQVEDNGFICEAETSSHGPMYGHGFATLFLAEAYGMSPRRDLREKLSRAVKLIIDTQNEDGGWRYQPQRLDADLSVTVCEVMALRAAHNAGIHVPQVTIQRCVDYVKRSQNPDGGFRYLLNEGPSAFPRSAAGVVSLYSAGVYEGREIDLALDYLEQHPPTRHPDDEQSHFYYGHYYAVQAMWQAGGDRWQRWYPAIRDLLISVQSEDGSWSSSICPEYGTAMATIILQVPNDCLPILQR